jgi:type IV pilus assembly protein PilE
MKALCHITQGTSMKYRNLGFTLIELMIAVAIVGILLAVALPSYKDQIVKTRRSDGKAALTNVAQQLERCFSQHGKYTGTSCPADASTHDSEEEWYEVEVDSTASTYTLTATPQGAQNTDDTKCKKLTLTQTGVKGIVGGSGTAADCW